MTLVHMNQTDWKGLTDERLGAACMEPTFQRIRGKSPEIKTEVISHLTPGQKALCMFRVMYDHAKPSPAEYYAWISYMMDLPGYWSGVMEGLRFFGDANMIGMLEETQEALAARNTLLGKEWSSASLSDMERDEALRITVNSLFARFTEIASVSLQNIASYIRTHPQEFVQLEAEPFDPASI
ncbi:hypothetical protein GCM10010912_25780 [Paenibacillus albidus]|uniref:Uncharacterized protein n=1 Tax=Paenibacillus albidus TaxID=2041023 RepID=A0A917C9Q9_9BACL|nr:hypothetical protein [Paenibacillus albidus]GGF79626.1 hypothetical protein GCM10010912_25780 [Paenibacillus albidus]